MGYVLAIASPGQGAQTPGFLTSWLELPGAEDRLTWWSAVTGRDLIRYGTTADAEEIRDTVAQPLFLSARGEPRQLPEGCVAALNNSFGFGGRNVCVAFRTHES